MTYLRSLLSILALVCFLGGVLPTVGLAQTLLPQVSSDAGAVTDEPPSPNDVKELIRLLEDQRIKNWLEKGAEGLGANEDAGSQVFGEGLKSQFAATLDRTRERARLLQGVWRHLPDAPELLAAEWRESMAPGGTVRSLTYVLIFLFIGGGLEWLYRQYTGARLLRLQCVANRLRARFPRFRLHRYFAIE